MADFTPVDPSGEPEGQSLAELLGVEVERAGARRDEGSVVDSELAARESEILRSLSEVGELPDIKSANVNPLGGILAVLGDALFAKSRGAGQRTSNFTSELLALTEGRAARASQRDSKRFEASEARKRTVASAELAGVRARRAATQSTRAADTDFLRSNALVTERDRLAQERDRVQFDRDQEALAAQEQRAAARADAERLVREAERGSMRLERMQDEALAAGARVGLDPEGYNLEDYEGIIDYIADAAVRGRELQAEAEQNKGFQEESQATRLEIEQFMNGLQASASPTGKAQPGFMSAVEAARTPEDLADLKQMFDIRRGMWLEGRVHDSAGLRATQRLIDQMNRALLSKQRALASAPPAEAPGTFNLIDFLDSLGPKLEGVLDSGLSALHPDPETGTAASRDALAGAAGNADLSRATAEAVRPSAATSPVDSAPSAATLAPGIGSNAPRESLSSRARNVTGGVPWSTPGERDAMIQRLLGDNRRALTHYEALSERDRERGAREMLAALRAGE